MYKHIDSDEWASESYWDKVRLQNRELFGECEHYNKQFGVGCYDKCTLNHIDDLIYPVNCKDNSSCYYKQLQVKDKMIELMAETILALSHKTKSAKSCIKGYKERAIKGLGGKK